MELEKTSNVSLRFYNIVIQPARFHKADCYSELMRKIFQRGEAMVTGSDKATKMRSLSETNEMMVGQLINYSTLSTKNWYDEVADSVIEHDTEPNLYPNAKEWDFYFSPAKHRMAVVVKRGVSWAQFEKFWSKSFDEVCENLGYDKVVFNRVTSVNAIDAIYNLDTIDSLEIEISYSNNDNNDVYTDAIDDELKSSNVSMLKTRAVGTKLNPITLKKEGNSMLNSLLKLSRSNGYVTARGKIGRETKKINTRDYPLISTLVKVTPSNLISNVRNLLNNLKD